MIMWHEDNLVCYVSRPLIFLTFDSSKNIQAQICSYARENKFLANIRQQQQPSIWDFEGLLFYYQVSETCHIPRTHRKHANTYILA